MPTTDWRTDPNPYGVFSHSAPLYRGYAIATGTTEAAVRSATATADLVSTPTGVATFMDRSVDPGGPMLGFRFAQGFVAIEFDSAINPADPDTTWAPQIPWFDPDTERPDWLGNITGDPNDGVIWESTHGSLATDQDANLDVQTFEPAPSEFPPLLVWQADVSAVYHDGTGWHGSVVPFDDTEAAWTAAGGYSLPSATTPKPFFPGEYWYVTHRESFPIASLRADNSVGMAYSLYPDPAVVFEQTFDDMMSAGAGAGWSAQIYYYSPRYKLIFKDLPQRQYPRDDGLGISTRRSWPPPTSRQYGTRRGPTATYW